jgi:Sec-independent protein translocase protein TatA
MGPIGFKELVIIAIVFAVIWGAKKFARNVELNRRANKRGVKRRGVSSTRAGD